MVFLFVQRKGITFVQEHSSAQSAAKEGGKPGNVIPSKDKRKTYNT